MHIDMTDGRSNGGTWKSALPSRFAYLGSIQPLGVLFVLNESDYRIIQISDNAQKWLGISSDQVLGSTLANVIGEQQALKIADIVFSCLP